MSAIIDSDVKARHRTMWAAGNYPAAAALVIPDLGATLVEACGVRRGDRVLDIATGAGNAAIPAALAGALVTACDLTPELLDAGRLAASGSGSELTWQVADAEALPYDDGGFDVVMSCLGVMFTPDHEASAGELLRVCRPGGRIGLIAWTAPGFIGQLFATMKPYIAAPPPGARSALLWGDEGYVRELFGGRVRDLRAEQRVVHVDRLATPEQFRELFKTSYGPTVAAYQGLADRPQMAAALDRDLVELAARNDHGAGPLVMDWEYLLVTAVRAGEP